MMWSDIKQTKKIPALCWLISHSYAFAWGKCPKNEAVKILLLALWPSTHWGKTSGHLVSSDKCSDPALMDKPCLSHYHFLSDDIGREKASFLASSSLKEKKNGLRVEGAFIKLPEKLFWNALPGSLPPENEIWPIGGPQIHVLKKCFRKLSYVFDTWPPCHLLLDNHWCYLTLSFYTWPTEERSLICLRLHS